MSGEKNLAKLLLALSPVLMDGEFVFLSFAQANYGEHGDLKPIACFKENEGLSLVVPKHAADKQHLNYTAVFKGITLNVHSSLMAVGLTAAVAAQLTAHGIGANVIAGCFHDHVFVPIKEAERAIYALKTLA